MENYSWFTDYIPIQHNDFHNYVSLPEHKHPNSGLFTRTHSTKSTKRQIALRLLSCDASIASYLATKVPENRCFLFEKSGTENQTWCVRLKTHVSRKKNKVAAVSFLPGFNYQLRLKMSCAKNVHPKVCKYMILFLPENEKMYDNRTWWL